MSASQTTVERSEASAQNTSERLVKTRTRIQQHGEVFTPDWVVNEMLNLLPSEGDQDVWAISHANTNSNSREPKIISVKRFLEPACGEGAFLTRILQRKLEQVWQAYGSSSATQADFEWNAAIACSSVYGIELLEDNAEQCTMNLIEVFNRFYERYGDDRDPEVRKAVQFLISRNIIQGNALTYKQANGKPIIFSEWTPIITSKDKRQLLRKDYTYEGLSKARETAKTLFAEDDPGLIKTYEPINWLEVRYVQ